MKMITDDRFKLESKLIVVGRGFSRQSVKAFFFLGGGYREVASQ
jgi:hypothetical protein